MVETVVFLGVAWLVAIAGGITASLMGWATDPSPKQGFTKFNAGKFGGAVGTGLVTGLVFGITSASINPVFKDPNANPFDIVYQLGLVFVGAVGLDHIRNRVVDIAKERSDNPQTDDTTSRSRSRGDDTRTM